MSGQETFEFAAAIAGVSIGLAGVLLLSVLAVVGTWRLFRHTSDMSLAATRAAVTVEDLARRLAGQQVSSMPVDLTPVAELSQRAEVLIDQQRELQETARHLLDTAMVEGAPATVGLGELEAAVGRLDTTVGQMAASLANLIQLLEQRER